MERRRAIEKIDTGRLKKAGTRIRDALAGAVLAAGLMLTPMRVKADSVELMAGNRSATADLKVSAGINDRLGTFIRMRPSLDYNGNLAFFGLADLTLNLAKGFDAVGEVQVLRGSVLPRAGVQYFKQKGDFSVYALATVGMEAKPYAEMILALKYSPELAKDLRLLAMIEDVTDIGRAGHLFSVQRLRLGLEYKRWGFGAAADLTQSGNHPDLDGETFGWNVGGFLSRRF